MENVQIFTNSAFGELRVTMIEGEPWIVGKDVAAILGYKETAKAIREHVDAEDKGVSEMDTPGGKQNVVIINESGLYSLVMSSKLPDAKKFRRWVTSEVLPSIRKTGGYIHGAKDMTDMEIVSKAFLIAQKTIELRDARIGELEAKAQADAPAVLYAKTAAGAKNGALIREFCKYLRPMGVRIGEKRMFADLREHGFLIKSGRDKNKPTQRAVEMSLFFVRETAVNTPLGAITRTTPLLTGKGKIYFTNVYLSGKWDAPDDAEQLEITETA